jgi:hypothetical protein
MAETAREPEVTANAAPEAASPTPTTKLGLIIELLQRPKGPRWRN